MKKLFLASGLFCILSAASALSGESKTATVAGIGIKAFVSVDAQYRKSLGRNARFSFAPGEIEGTPYSDTSQFKMDLQHKPVEWLSVGADLKFTLDNTFMLQQAYGKLRCPKMSGWELTVGKVDLPFGWEPVEPMELPTVTTGIIGQQLAGQVLGAGLTWANETISASLMVLNGADQIPDNNDMKTLIAMIGYSHPGFDITLSLMGGPEQSDNTRFSNTIDLVAEMNPIERVSAALEGLFQYNKFEGQNSYKSAYGAGAVISYRIFEKVAFTTRGEWFKANGAYLMFGRIADPVNGVSAIPGKKEVAEISFAPAVYLGENAILKAEYRYDFRDFSAHTFGLNTTYLF